jgi:hypothetical protein
MTESECLERMIPPGKERPIKPFFHGVIQILVTSSCDKACFNCTQASNTKRPYWEMTPQQFEDAVKSLEGYWGVLGLFGGNPAVSKHFHSYCQTVQRYWPRDRAGIWCNNPITVEKARMMRTAFHPMISNLNCHGDQEAHRKFKEGWPESAPFGIPTATHSGDSRHSPPWVAMKDVLHKRCDLCQNAYSARETIPGVIKAGDSMYRDPVDGTYKLCPRCNGTGHIYDEEEAWRLISGCDINQKWSASIGIFRGELRAWFCEVAMAQAILHQDNPGYVATGIRPELYYTIGSVTNPRTSERVGTLSGHTDRRMGSLRWWELPMTWFADQVRKHCHECGVPLRGHGQLAVGGEYEEVSRMHEAVYKPKDSRRPLRVISSREELGQPLMTATAYLQNANR